VDADALNHLQRFNEAINASKEAIRLSDGKYAFMHFRLGTSHFDTENWELARQSFENAAELDTKDDAAAYNVAVSLTRLGYFGDAAHWFEEALRRNPNRNDRDDLRRRIESLRR
jgi:tetratricopeptide (TPR) repeat protein